MGVSADSHYNSPMSLRSRVFHFVFEAEPSIKQVYREFSKEPKTTVEQYYYQAKKKYSPNINPNITIKVDTIKEMEICIHQIKDPVKRSEAISRLHTMKLRPLVNKEQVSLKEMLDG